jgi:hypothetical protein
VKSFLRSEIRLFLFAVSFAFVVMTVLFIFPVFVSGSPRFSWLTEMEIVSRVVIPLWMLFSVMIVGTAVNAIIQLVRAVRGRTRR